jgi:hypothetical protein
MQTSQARNAPALPLHAIDFVALATCAAAGVGVTAVTTTVKVGVAGTGADLVIGMFVGIGFPVVALSLGLLARVLVAAGLLSVGFLLLGGARRNRYTFVGVVVSAGDIGILGVLVVLPLLRQRYYPFEPAPSAAPRPFRPLREGPEVLIFSACGSRGSPWWGESIFDTWS